MLNVIKWKVISKSDPCVQKNCSKCGGNAWFKNSNKFRVNANQSRLDVWLIYQCTKCKTTWNMEILSRVNPKEIPKDQYQKFLNNDKSLASFYACNAEIHKRYGVKLDYEGAGYSVEGEKLDLSALQNKVMIEIECDKPIDIRVDKLLSMQLGLSREKIKSLIKQGVLCSQGESKLWHAKPGNKLCIDVLIENL